MKAAKSDAAKTGNTSGGVSKCPLPVLYHRVIERLGSHKARFEEFDFAHYNRTRLLGFTNDLANCYVNPVLQMLHFVPELRSKVLMGHTCDREFCLTCELGFLSHMLSQPPTIGAGSHSSSSMTCQVRVHTQSPFHTQTPNHQLPNTKYHPITDRTPPPRHHPAA